MLKCYKKEDLEYSARQAVALKNLVINRINHPTQEMHKLFADALFETIFNGTDTCEARNDENAMYQNEGN